jgi:hypothetical protein
LEFFSGRFNLSLGARSKVNAPQVEFLRAVLTPNTGGAQKKRLMLAHAAADGRKRIFASYLVLIPYNRRVCIQTPYLIA